MTTHREESGSAAARPRLPVDGVVVVTAPGQQVHCRYDHQVDAHAEVGEGQVAHEEAGNGQLGAAAWGTDGGRWELVQEQRQCGGKMEELEHRRKKEEIEREGHEKKKRQNRRKQAGTDEMKRN